MFKPLGVLVFAYVLYCISNGSVYARSGWRGRSVDRATEPNYFWVVIVIYSGLSLALVFVF